MAKMHIFNGQIVTCDHGDDSGVGIATITMQKTINGDTIQNQTPGIALAKWADDTIYNKQVSIRYLISAEPITDPSEMMSEYIMVVMGKSSAHFYGSYSDYTGHLWTNEKFVVGGHDVIKELNSAFGKYIHMEIEVH